MWPAVLPSHCHTFLTSMGSTPRTVHPNRSFLSSDLMDLRKDSFYVSCPSNDKSTTQGGCVPWRWLSDICSKTMERKVLIYHILTMEQIAGPLQCLWVTLPTATGIMYLNKQRLRKRQHSLQDADGRWGRGHQKLVCGGDSVLSNIHSYCTLGRGGTGLQKRKCPPSNSI